MTDRELLEAAAEAAGIEFVVNANGARVYLRSDGTMWAPLQDDGDALRLAVRMGLTVATYGMGPYVKDAQLRMLASHGECSDAELPGVVRRLIVRAAAAMVQK